MAEKLEDLNLPNAVVTRIIKEVLPEGFNISKESRIAVAKAASVFILYLTSAANMESSSNTRKTINAQDVIQALRNVEFNHFIESAYESLETFKKMQKGKKDATAKRKMQKEGRKSDEHNASDIVDKDSGLEVDFENGMETNSDITYECDT